MIFEILGVILGSFFGTFKGLIPVIPSILDLKDTLEQLTPMGMLQTGLAAVGVPALVVTILVFVVKFVISKIQMN